MPAPKGNKFWMLRSSHGLKPMFDSPEQLWSACVEYFEWVQANPLFEAKAFAYKGEVTVAQLPSRMRAMTIEGLCVFLDIHKSTWIDYRNRKRFGDVVLSPVYRSPAAGFRGPDFLNAIALVDSDIHPFALNDWLHALELAHGRDRRDANYSNRPLDIDIIYFGELVLDGPGDFQLPRPELHHAFVLKPLADVAPDFVDPIRGMTLARLWAAHPEHDSPPEQVDITL